MYNVSIIITESCNARCTHCYMGNRLSKKTLSKKQIDTIINKLPENTESIAITGGEIFLHKGILYYALKQIQKQKPNIKIQIQSNGIYFYRNMNKVKKEFKTLKELGVDEIRFSDDPFHASGGVILEKVRSLKQYEGKDTPIIRYLVQDKALPIGKAAELDDNYKDKKNCMNNKNTIKHPYLFIDIRGDVFICNWEIVPPIGNIFNDKFSEIEKRLKEEFYSCILQGDILKAINIVSNDKNNKEYIKEHGECMLCNKVFKNKKS